MMQEYTAEIGSALRAVFPEAEIKRRQGASGRTFAYIDARAVMDRLDEVVGPGNWSTEYRLIDPDRMAVECRLTVLGVTKSDIGYPNAAADAARQDEEPLKSAYSDALKRAGVQHGIGRFLYSLPMGTGGHGGQQQNRTNTRQSSGWDDRAPLPDRIAASSAPPHAGQGVLTLGNPRTSQDQRVVLPATEPQIKAIFAIARGAQAMDEAEVEARCKELYGVTPDGLSRRHASEFIDVLKGGGGN